MEIVAVVAVVGVVVLALTRRAPDIRVSQTYSVGDDVVAGPDDAPAGREEDEADWWRRGGRPPAWTPGE